MKQSYNYYYLIASFSDPDLSLPHQSQKCHSTPTPGITPTDPIFIPEQDSRSAPADEVHWVKELGPKGQDKYILSTGEWLTDLHVAAANKLLKEQYPLQNGLQDTFALADRCHPVPQI